MIPLRRVLVHLALLLALASPTLAETPKGGSPAKGPEGPPSASFGMPPAGDLPAPDRPRPLGESLTGEAKVDYDAALLLYKSGDFAGAARRFASAYETAGDVRLLWNAAACEQGLRHYAKAIVLVRRYLGSHSPLISEDGERAAKAFLDAALPLTARLGVEANEAESNVLIDGELVGTLPLDAETRVDFGTHQLVVRKPEFVDHTEELSVTNSADIHVKVKLLPVAHQGRLVVRAGKGDSIALDGHFRGLSTFDGVVPSGKHLIRVTATGFRPFESSVLIEDDRTRALDVTLEAAPVSSGIPSWVWVAGGAAVLAGAGTAAYFAFRSSDSGSETMPSGSAGKVQLPLR